MLSTNSNKIIALMFHRVASVETDPWQLCVHPEKFAEQVEFLSQNYSLSEGLGSVNQSSSDQPVVLITFDDGYLDNLINARPILEEFGAPATFFIATQYLEGSREYWWDELERLILSPSALPNSLHIDHAGNGFSFELDSDRVYSEQQAETYAGWTVTFGNTPLPTRRHLLFRELWIFLWKLNEGHRRVALDRVRDWAGSEVIVREKYRPMTVDELKRLSDSRCCNLGSHTITHSVLPHLESTEKWEELAESKKLLEQISGDSIMQLAYPHGDYDEETIHLAVKSGYELAFGTSAVRFPLQPGRFQIPRLMVKNWSAEQLQQQMSEFLDG
jgi:peptidoglycan/xylan/chitin deacetylase (PgdA/CDA1 family)